MLMPASFQARNDPRKVLQKSTLASFPGPRSLFGSGLCFGNFGGSRSVLWTRFVHLLLALASFQRHKLSPKLVRKID